MFTRKVRFAIAVSTIFYLTLSTGCAYSPPIDFVLQDVKILENRKDAELRSISVVYASIEQRTGKIEAGVEISRLWKDALSDALNRSLAFRDSGIQKLNLLVRIVEFDEPSPGLTMTTKVSAIYELIDRETGSVVLTEAIENKGVVEPAYAFNGMDRMFESRNRAVRSNIGEFIKRLNDRDLSASAP